MLDILRHAHAGLRWIVLVLLVVAIVNAFSKWRGNKKFNAGDQKLALFALIFTHVQILLGIALYVLNIGEKVQFGANTMKDSLIRFFTVEHISMMLVAAVLITIGYSKAKRAPEAAQRFKTTFWFYLVGLLLILASIPWPPRHGASWF